MKKAVRMMITLCLLAFVLSPYCFAEDLSQYKDSFSLIGGEKLEEIIDENAKDFLSKNDIDISDYSWTNKLNLSSVFGELSEIIKNGLSGPVKSGITILSVILLTAGFSSFDLNSGTKRAVLYAIALSLSIIVIRDIFSLITASVSALTYISNFMLAFIPVFVLSVSLSGAPVSGTAFSGVILVLARVISYFACSYIMPVMGGYLSLNLVTSMSPFGSLSDIAEMIKKAVNWTLTLIFTVFVSLIGIQSTVNSAADSFAMKTAKFIIGTCIPIAGNALSESASTIYSSMNLLKSSVGIYGVLIVAVGVLPLLIKLLLWKAVLGFCGAVSKTFSQTSIASLLCSINSLLSVLVAIMLFTGGVFIISLAIVVSVTKI